jgi:hypothetical protein
VEYAYKGEERKKKIMKQKRERNGGRGENRKLKLEEHR